MPSPIVVYVDADACPVKDEVFRVAGRYGLHVIVVANSFMLLPREPWIERVVVADGPDAADDWIVQRVGKTDIVITADIPLASRCVKAEAAVLSPTGRAFTDESIGLALATRNLMTDLREAGAVTRGPKPFSSSDRSAFLGALDRAVNPAAPSSVDPSARRCCLPVVPSSRLYPITRHRRGRLPCGSRFAAGFE